jgi:hypothetical protein
MLSNTSVTPAVTRTETITLVPAVTRQETIVVSPAVTQDVTHTIKPAEASLTLTLTPFEAAALKAILGHRNGFIDGIRFPSPTARPVDTEIHDFVCGAYNAASRFLDTHALDTLKDPRIVDLNENERARSDFLYEHRVDALRNGEKRTNRMTG